MTTNKQTIGSIVQLTDKSPEPIDAMKLVPSNKQTAKAWVIINKNDEILCMDSSFDEYPVWVKATWLHAQSAKTMKEKGWYAARATVTWERKE